MCLWQHTNRVDILKRHSFCKEICRHLPINNNVCMFLITSISSPCRKHTYENSNLTFQMCLLLQTSHNSPLSCMIQIYRSLRKIAKRSFISIFPVSRCTAGCICHFSLSRITWSKLAVSVCQHQSSLIPQI